MRVHDCCSMPDRLVIGYTYIPEATVIPFMCDTPLRSVLCLLDRGELFHQNRRPKEASRYPGVSLGSVAGI